MILTLISHSSRPASSGLSGAYRNARNTALPGSLLVGKGVSSFENENVLGQSEKFEILSNFNPPFVSDLQKVMENNDIHVAGFEYILDKKGNPYYYDINTNTNYNAAAEKRAGISAMDRLAEYLGTVAEEC